MDLDYSPIKQRLNKYCYPRSSLLSVYLLGTTADEKTTSSDGDIDFLFIIKDNLKNDFLIPVGIEFRKALKDIFKNKKTFIFDSPSYDRPDILAEGTIRIHLLVHKESWVRHSLDTNNWVFTCWSNKNKLLVGQKILKGKKGVLNLSLVDEFDGLPSIIKRIDFSILSYDITKYQPYFQKLYKYSVSRYNEIVKEFSELNFEVFETKRKSIIESDILFVRNLLDKLSIKIKTFLGKIPG